MALASSVGRAAGTFNQDSSKQGGVWVWVYALFLFYVVSRCCRMTCRVNLNKRQLKI